MKPLQGEQEETVRGKEGGGREAGPSWRLGWNPLQASGHLCLFLLKNNRFGGFFVLFFCLTIKNVGTFQFLGLPLATTLTVPFWRKNKSALLCPLHWVSLQVVENFRLKTCISHMLPFQVRSLPATKRGQKSIQMLSFWLCIWNFP